jgi:hypothetical protein
MSMPRLRNLLWLAAPVLAACSQAETAVEPAVVVDISGAWTSDASHCDKVFARRRDGIGFTKIADLFGSGFIVDGRRIRARKSQCEIKHRNSEGTTVHLVAACANDIMLSDVQMSLKVVGRDNLVRIFPGMPDLQATFERCVVK